MNIPFLSKTKTKTKTETSPSHCCHQTKEGNPCNATPQAGKAYCFFHDPEVAEERAAARRQGGLISIGKAAPVVPPNLPPVSLKTLDDVSQFFEQITNYVLQGQMDLRTAATLRSLANGALRTLQAIARSQREAVKATLPGKGVSFPTSALGETGTIRNGRKAEPGQPGVPHSRGSACGNSHSGLKSLSPTPEPAEAKEDQPKAAASEHVPKTLTWEEASAIMNAPPNALAPRPEKPHPSQPTGEDRLPLIQTTALAVDLAQQKHNQQRIAMLDAYARALAPVTMRDCIVTNEGVQPAPPAPAQPQVRDPDYEPACIPGLQNRHLNYLKYAGMPVPPSQRKRIRIDPEDVSGYSVRRVEFDLNTARARRDGGR